MAKHVLDLCKRLDNRIRITFIYFDSFEDELFRLVVGKGGLVEVINKKLWREVTKGLNLPSSITSAAFTLRTQYVSNFFFFFFEREVPDRLSISSRVNGEKYIHRLVLLFFSLLRYMKYLYPYECEKLQLSSPGELQAAIGKIN